MAKTKKQIIYESRAGKRLADCFFKLAKEILESGKFTIVRAAPLSRGRKKYMGELLLGVKAIYIPPDPLDAQTLFHEMVHIIITGVENYSLKKTREYEKWEEKIVERITNDCWLFFSNAQITYFRKKLLRS
ncbi:MAG: hypothetical protein WD898_03905 [Candidatus Paceibacterota bacterium]